MCMEEDQSSIKNLSLEFETPYEFVMKYEKGEDNIAYYLSRHLCKNTEYCSLAEAHVNFMADTSKPIALSMSKLIYEPNRDNILQSVLLLHIMECYCVTQDWFSRITSERSSCDYS